MDFELKFDVSLKERTTIKVGGAARRFYVIHKIDAIQRIIKNIGENFYLLGKGSNILAADTLSDVPVITLGQEFSYVKEHRGVLEIGAAASLAKVIHYCIERNLTGIEYMIGIPATIGGLLRMNASCFGKEISAFIKEVEVVDKKTAEIFTLQKNEIVFSYRASSLRDYIISRVWFSLEQSSRVKEKAAVCFNQRLEKQDYELPNCGCVFKNPPDLFAGQLIDLCGLKGKIRGGAMVSTKHANFIVNTGKAAYADVDGLIQEIKDKVYAKHGVVLEEEIERWA